MLFSVSKIVCYDIIHESTKGQTNFKKFKIGNFENLTILVFVSGIIHRNPSLFQESHIYFKYLYEITLQFQNFL